MNRLGIGVAVFFIGVVVGAVYFKRDALPTAPTPAPAARVPSINPPADPNIVPAEAPALPGRVDGNGGKPVEVPADRPDHFLMLDARLLHTSRPYRFYYRCVEPNASFETYYIDPKMDVAGKTKIEWPTDGSPWRSNVPIDAIWIRSTDSRGVLHFVYWWEPD